MNKKYAEIMIRMARGFASYITFLFAVVMFGYSFVTERNGEELVSKTIKEGVMSVAALLIFASVYSVFAKYDGLAYDEFLTTRRRKFKLSADSLAVIRSFEFIFDSILVTVMSLLLPIPTAFPLLVAADFAVRLLVRRLWYHGRPYDGSAILLLLRDLAIWIIGYCFIAYLGPSYVGIFGIVGWLAIEHIYVTVAVIFVPSIIYFLVSYGVAFCKRAAFLKMLKKGCRANGYKLSKIKRPYFSILDVTETEDFTVEANGKIYVCKLLSGKRRNVPMIFCDDGTAMYEHGIGFGKTKFLNYYKKFSYELPDIGTKCVIVTHHPQKFFTEKQGSTRPLHLGDSFGGYNLVHPDGFIRCIKSDTLS